MSSPIVVGVVEGALGLPVAHGLEGGEAVVRRRCAVGLSAATSSGWASSSFAPAREGVRRRPVADFPDGFRRGRGIRALNLARRPGDALGVADSVGIISRLVILLDGWAR